MAAMTTAKRHHYVPRFLLRRFAEDPGAKHPSIWWLSKETGANRRNTLENEAVIGQFYRLSAQVALPPGLPEKTLADIEAGAVEAMRALEIQPASLTTSQRQALVLHLVLQRKRTPAARRQFRFMDELTLKLQTEIDLHNPESWAAALQAAGDFESPEQAEAARLAALQQFQEGEISVESSADREITGIFLGVQQTVEAILNSTVSWYLLRSRSGRHFVLGDDPVALFDPTQIDGEGGLGFLYPTVETTLPLSPTACLLMQNDGGRRVQEIDADDYLVRHINLRSYAHADQSIWGCRLGDVTEVRADAKAHPVRLHTVRRRDGVIWIGEPVPDEPGTYEFEGHSSDGKPRRRRSRVDADARRR